MNTYDVTLASDKVVSISADKFFVEEDRLNLYRGGKQCAVYAPGQWSSVIELEEKEKESTKDIGTRESMPHPMREIFENAVQKEMEYPTSIYKASNRHTYKVKVSKKSCVEIRADRSEVGKENILFFFIGNEPIAQFKDWLGFFELEFGEK